MNKEHEQFLGMVRAALTALAGVLVAFGVRDGHQWQPAIGVLMFGVSLAWGLYYKTGAAAAWSVLRKLINAAGMAAGTYGMLTPDRAEALVGLAGPLIAILSSWQANGGQAPRIGNGAPVLLALLAALALVGLPGCTVSLDPVTGRPVVGADAATIQAITAEVLAEINEDLQRPGK